MQTTPKTFTQWLLWNCAAEIPDLAENGAQHGVSGMTTYAETAALYATYKTEIWERISADAGPMGFDSPLRMIAECYNGTVDSVESFENLLVWAHATAIARDIVNGDHPSDEANVVQFVLDHGHGLEDLT